MAEFNLRTKFMTMDMVNSPRLESMGMMVPETWAKVVRKLKINPRWAGKIDNPSQRVWAPQPEHQAQDGVQGQEHQKLPNLTDGPDFTS